MEEVRKISGNMTLRMPKSLHNELIELAKEEGVSLNQYCVYVLSEKLSRNMLGKKKLNKKLKMIRDNCSSVDLEAQLNQIKILNKEVIELKPIIQRELKELLSIRKNRLTKSDEENLELKYPIICNKVSEESDVTIKIPTLKIVISPKGKMVLDDNGIKDDIKKSFKDEDFENKIVYTQINIDEIGEHCILDYKSKIIFILEEDINKIDRYIKQIKLNLEQSDQKHKFVVNISPTFILCKI